MHAHKGLSVTKKTNDSNARASFKLSNNAICLYLGENGTLYRKHLNIHQHGYLLDNCVA